MKKNIILVLVIFLVFVVVFLLGNSKKSSEEEVSTDGFFDLHVAADFNKNDYLNKGYPVLLDIGGAECIPCRNMAPVLEELNEELNDKAVIKFVDYWKYPDLAKQFEFSVIPTQYFYDEFGELYTTHEGEITKTQVLAIFAEMGYTFSG